MQVLDILLHLILILLVVEEVVRVQLVALQHLEEVRYLILSQTKGQDIQLNQLSRSQGLAVLERLQLHQW